MISGNVPKHLVAGARTGFIKAASDASKLMSGRNFAMELASTKNEEQMVDLGEAPMPREESKGLGSVPRDFIEKQLLIKPKNWETTVWISWNADKDDQTKTLRRKVTSAGQQFERAINKRIFQTLNGGDAATFGLCYDGQFFFDSDHSDAGAEYQTAQDNVSALALSPTNFETVWAASRIFRDDQGEFPSHEYNLIVTDPTSRSLAFNIAKNVKVAGTGNNDLNPFAGEIEVITSPYMDTGSWVLASQSPASKPLILLMREAPHLQHAWFDPQAPDGGRWYFKFYARYNVAYGDWRLAHMGKS